MTKQLIIYLVVLGFITISLHVVGQTVTKKDLCGKWDFDSFTDKMKVGDTLFFKSDKKGNDTFLKCNATLKRHTFYGYCGNKSFADYFTRKPRAWETVGSWSLSNIENKTILTMNIGDKTMTFLFASRDNKQYAFVLKNTLTK